MSLFLTKDGMTWKRVRCAGFGVNVFSSPQSLGSAFFVLARGNIFYKPVVLKTIVTGKIPSCIVLPNCWALLEVCSLAIMSISLILSLLLLCKWQHSANWSGTDGTHHWSTLVILSTQKNWILVSIDMHCCRLYLPVSLCPLFKCLYRVWNITKGW